MRTAAVARPTAARPAAAARKAAVLTAAGDADVDLEETALAKKAVP